MARVIETDKYFNDIDRNNARTEQQIKWTDIREQKLREKYMQYLECNIGDTDYYKDNPEYMFLEEERIKSIKEFITQYTDELTFNELVCIFSLSKNNLNVSKSAREVNMTIGKFNSHIKKAREKAFQVMNEMGIDKQDMYEAMTPTPINNTRSDNEKIGLRFELYMKLPKGQTYEGREFSTSKKYVCRIPEYIGCTEPTACISCSLCNDVFDCSRSDIFLANKKPIEWLEKHKLELQECIQNIKEDMQEEDYSYLKEVI